MMKKTMSPRTTVVVGSSNITKMSGKIRMALDWLRSSEKENNGEGSEEENNGERNKEIASDGGGNDPLGESLSNGEQEADKHKQQGNAARGEKQKVGVFLPPNTLAHALIQFCHPLDMTPLEALELTFGVDVPVEYVSDVSMGRNLLQIEDAIQQINDATRKSLIELSHSADFAIIPSSLGTGYPAYKFVDVGLTFGKTCDLVVPSHKTRLGLLKNPKNAILAGVGSAVIDSPAILVDHQKHVPQNRVMPAILAKIIGALTQVDIYNRGYGYMSVGIETVPIGGAEDIDISPQVMNAVNNLEPLATAEQWAQWDVESGDLNADETIPTLADPDLKVILPHGVQIGHDDRFGTVHADVVDAHVVGTWQLDPQWVNKHVRRHGAEYVDQEIRDPNSPLRHVWESHAGKFGFRDDPVGRWDDFYSDNIEPRLPEP